MSEEWAARADLPPHVVQLLNDFPSELHPMSQLSAAVTAMNSESHFAKGYSNGIKKSEFWEVTKANVVDHSCSKISVYLLAKSF